jgi:hypothetical protein
MNRMNNEEPNNPLAVIQSNVLDSKNDALKVPKATEPTKMRPELAELVMDKLKALMFSGFLRVNPDATEAQFRLALSTLLRETGAIISGGFILNALGLYPAPRRREVVPSDLDIYVPCKNVVRLYRELLPWIAERSVDDIEVTSYKASKYCSSFLRKNGIRRVYTFEDYSLGNKRSIDIMAVRNARDVRDVVKNFDLTFCMNWYNGVSLYSMYPQHVDHKVGLLQGDYVKMFILGNRFLKARIEKYRRRGFTIRLDPAAVSKVDLQQLTETELFCIVDKPVRNSAFYFMWASKALLEFMLTKRIRGSRSRKLRVNEHTIYNNEHAIFDDDGYDSDEYVLTSPDDPNKEAIKAKFIAVASREANKHDATLADKEDESKFWQLVTRCISFLHNNSRENPFFTNMSRKHIPRNDQNNNIYTTEEHWQEVLSIEPIAKCLKAMKELFVRIDADPVTLDDLQVFDFHAHRLDQGGSQQAINGLLQAQINNANKDEITCYITAAEGCGRYLTRSDVRPFASPEVFMQYVNTKPPVEMIPLGTDVYWGAILRNNPAPAPPFGTSPINHETLCPFCLRQEGRQAGCTYMQHHTEIYDSKKAPYCRPSEQVKELWKKYKTFQQALPKVVPGETIPLEFCAVCGRPCHGHNHFDLTRPGKIIKHNNRTSDYGVCPGGRAELIARMLAIRAVMLAHRGDAAPDHAAIREEAAFAADFAPLDEALTM